MNVDVRVHGECISIRPRTLDPDKTKKGIEAVESGYRIKVLNQIKSRMYVINNPINVCEKGYKRVREQ